MNYIKQTWSEMKAQPLAVWLSIGGTALSIFLIMVVYMLSELPSVEISPESARKRLLIGEYVHYKVKNEAGNSSEVSADLSYDIARRFYSDLEGIECISYFNASPREQDVSGDGEIGDVMRVRQADNNYWNIFDFEFLYGRPYSKEEQEAFLDVAVITAGVARKLFKSEDVVGRDVYIRQKPYRITGVVKDVNPIMSLTSSDIYTRLSESAMHPSETGALGFQFNGEVAVVMLRQKDYPAEKVKENVENRYKVANSEYKDQGVEFIYHDNPFDVVTNSIEHGSNSTPDSGSRRRMVWIAYLVLLLVPAINLSGMTRARMRKRISEIGVRRAFGSTRCDILTQLLGENLVVTLIGGVIGLAAGIIFVLMWSNRFFTLYSGWAWSEAVVRATPDFNMLFTWQGFAVAFLFCFVLNLVSAGLPVWKAASVNPADAISGSERK